MSWSNFPIPIQYLGGLLFSGVIQYLFPQKLFEDSSNISIIGWVTLIVGIWLLLWATKASGKINIESPSALITIGPYAFSRNPMYVGWSFLHLGITILVNSIWIALLLAVAIAITHFFDIPQEERSLTEKFGDEYIKYQKRVRRYI